MADEHTPYTAKLDRVEYETLRAQAGKIQQMIDSEAWKILTALVDQARGDASRRTIMGHAGPRGKVLEQAEYARILGYLAGTSELQVAAESFALALEKRRGENT